jgi:SAM-dependent methyltransferase
MSCCSGCVGYAAAERQFGPAVAERDLKSYRKKGPGPTTRLLRDLLADTGAIDGILLDVGSGIGGLTFELLERGVTRAIAVDASAAYLAAAAREATRRDRLRAIELVQGDFLEVAPQIPKATVVTLDRVICCYPSYEALLNESLRHAERLFAFSYPRDAWYVHAAIGFENRLRWLKRNPFRAFVHPVNRMTGIIERAGFKLVARRQTWQWSADVWTRASGLA